MSLQDPEFRRALTNFLNSHSIDSDLHCADHALANELIEYMHFRRRFRNAFEDPQMGVFVAGWHASLQGARDEVQQLRDRVSAFEVGRFDN